MFETLIIDLPVKLQASESRDDLEEFFDDVGSEGWMFTGCITTYNGAIFIRPLRGVSKAIDKQSKRAEMGRIMAKRRDPSSGETTIAGDV